MTQFNSEANGLDLYNDCLFWTGADSVSYPIAKFTRNANFALDRIVAKIFQADNHWEWDDSNQSDLPIATTTLVDSQQDYSIPVTHLKILRVRVKGADGNYIVLDPVNRRDLTDSELNAPAGLPKKYDKLGNSLFLYPKPSGSSVTTALGLEVQFQRGGSYFATTDTTKTPGFATQFHRLISLYPARDYCAVETLTNRLKVVDIEIARLETDLIDFYTSRDFDAKKSMSIRREDYGSQALTGSASNPNGF